VGLSRFTQTSHALAVICRESVVPVVTVVTVLAPSEFSERSHTPHFASSGTYEAHTGRALCGEEAGVVMCAQ
jgi:hypothetical protein